MQYKEAIKKERCPSIFPPSADAPHEKVGWSGPLRCVLNIHKGKHHINYGIRWEDK